MSTPNMNLVLPIPTVTVGPTWASQLNTALDLVDAHDHSSGKGVRITPSGLNINSALNINSQNLNNTNSLRLISQASPLVGGQDIRCIYAIGGDLYYNNSAGVAVQITNGSNVASAPAGDSIGYGRTSTSAATFNILPSATYSFVEANSTSNAISVNLPAANSVIGGRFFFIKDIAGTSATNAITINASGGNTIDGASSVVINSNFDAVQVVSNGSNAWAVYRVALGDGSVTLTKLAPSGHEQRVIEDLSSFDSSSGPYSTDIDWSTAETFSFDVDNNITFTFSNVPTAKTITVVIENTSASAINVTFPAGIKWRTGVNNPTVLSSSVSVYTFVKAASKTLAAVIRDIV